MADKIPPDPNGCGECGIDKRSHCRQYTRSVGWHQWIQPSNEEVLRRMRARHIVRNGGA